MANEFVKAEGLRVRVTNESKKTIVKMYSEILSSISQRIKFLESRTNVSSILRLQYLRELQEEIVRELKLVDSAIEELIMSNMLQVTEQVVKDNQALLRRFGFDSALVSTAYLHVPREVVYNIANGSLYEGKWSLSKAIWHDNALKNKELEYIVSQGVAANKSTFEIAKDLERYVNPKARKDWSWSKVYPNVRKVVDYNAQRLARTMISHAYEESFVRVTKNNPFIEAYKWLPSYGHRMCPLCESRGTQDQFGLGAGIFPKDQLPLDHPNGMCTFRIVRTKSYAEIADDLANWTQGVGNSKLNQKLDIFAKDLV